MPFQALRSRFTSNLESHQIDDDYTMTNNSPSISTVNSPVSDSHEYNTSTNLPRNSERHSLNSDFDPFEVVPSYETSQLLHSRENSTVIEQQPDHLRFHSPSQRSLNTIENTSGYNQSRLYTPIPSLPIPRTNSLVNISNNNSSSTSSLTPSPQLPNRINSTNSSATNRSKNRKITSIKQLGLKFLNARQHFLLAFCRDVSLIPPLISLIQSWKRCYFFNNTMVNNQFLTSARSLEHFLTGIWCLVSAYLSYSILDSLLVRWIVTYSTSAAIVRVLCMSTIMISCEFYLVSTFSAKGYQYGLHIWILISCLLTLTYTVQNFVTSNLQLNKETNVNQLKKRNRKQKRFFDFYNIVVFAVVPVGLASFVTMIGLLRSLLILRIDIDQTLNLTIEKQ